MTSILEWGPGPMESAPHHGCLSRGWGRKPWRAGAWASWYSRFQAPASLTLVAWVPPPHAAPLAPGLPGVETVVAPPPYGLDTHTSFKVLPTAGLPTSTCA